MNKSKKIPHFLHFVNLLNVKIGQLENKKSLPVRLFAFNFCIKFLY